MESTANENANNNDDLSSFVMIELRKIIQAIDRNSKSLVRRVGLTMPQLVIMRNICGLEEVSVGVIAKTVHLSDATVTGILERLEKRGYLIRRKSNSDRRRVLVKLTDLGVDLLKKAPPLMQEGFVQAYNALPAWNQTMIYSSLQQLAGIMNAGSIKAAPILTVSPIGEPD